jgi:hypothetical protein
MLWLLQYVPYEISYYMHSIIIFEYNNRVHVIVIALYILNVKLPIPTQKPEDGHGVRPKHVAK